MNYFLQFNVSAIREMKDMKYSTNPPGPLPVLFIHFL